MKLKVEYEAAPTLMLIPDDRRDTEILHRLAEQNNVRILYNGVSGSALVMQLIMIRESDGQRLKIFNET